MGSQKNVLRADVKGERIAVDDAMSLAPIRPEKNSRTRLIISCRKICNTRHRYHVLLFRNWGRPHFVVVFC
jgi:hypothetical protein